MKPIYMTALSAGADIYAYLEGGPITINPGGHYLVPTGIMGADLWGSGEGDPDFAYQVLDRSSMSWKHKVKVFNAPGLIDPDYEGEVKVHLYNAGSEPFVVTHGMRIAQLVAVPFIQSSEFLQGRVKRSGGHGSTGDR